MSTTASDFKTILKEVYSGNIEALKSFHQKYPGTHWSCLHYDKTGDTILHVAARLGHLDVIDFVLNNYKPSAADCRNKDNKTSLHEAAQFAQWEAVELLIRYGAEVNALKKADWTPLMLACTKINQTDAGIEENCEAIDDSCRTTQGNCKTIEDNYKTVEILLRAGAEVNYQNKDGWTSLHLIAREGDVRILELLLRHNLDLQKATKNGRTALHIAALHGRMDMVKKLITLGSDVNKTDSCGNTPLHDSILSGNLTISDLLLKNGADLYCRNKSDFTILHLAACQGDIGVIDYIISPLKVDVDIKTSSCLTALHCAARSKQQTAYKFLVEKGACENVKDKFGRVPSDYFYI